MIATIAGRMPVTINATKMQKRITGTSLRSCF
jgi:hypothetical protein